MNSFLDPNNTMLAMFGQCLKRIAKPVYDEMSFVMEASEMAGSE